jgi:DNA invertase Pin-like site-specific DNA recombinase
MMSKPDVQDGSAPKIRAVIYARMSTEHQQYSAENQSDAIREYATKHDMEIVRSYVDEGKSGLRIDGRNALKELIEVVQRGAADFEAILVYDVSRWGRFQDADESAYYEYICRRSGIAVTYCAEQFQNDGSPVSTIVKGVKRAMAGEYSRELSSKVFKGQCRLIQLGFRQGGMPGFGLRRMLVDIEGKPKGVLQHGEQKSIQTDRVILVLGPKDEVHTVRWIFEQFVQREQPERNIAEALNKRGILTDLGRLWTHATVKQILTNEKYIGNNVYNRVSFKLKKTRVMNPEEMWIRANDVFEGLIEPATFWKAREIILERARCYSDEELIAGLQELYKAQGWLSAIIIEECEALPSSCVFSHRFGGLLRAYRLVGYVPDHDYGYLETNRHLRQMHPLLVDSTITEMARLGGNVERDPQTDLLSVNGEFTVSLVLSRCIQTPGGSSRWNIRFDSDLNPDITVAVRMNVGNTEPLDYYLLPSLDMHAEKIRLAEYNGLSLDVYRFDTLDHFCGMARRVRIAVA